MILAAYDPQTRDRTPVELAAAFATLLDESLVLASVLPSGPLLSHAGASPHGAHHDIQRVRDELARSHPGLSVEISIVDAATASRGLITAVAGLEPALVVLGSRAGTPAGAVGVGRTARRVLGAVQCPVVVATAAVRPLLPRTIGAAVPDTTDGRRALRIATELARRAGAQLRVFSIVPTTLGSGASVPRQEQRAERQLTALEAMLADAPDAPGTAAEAENVIGDPADALTTASQHLDLLVMPSRGYGWQGVPAAGDVLHRTLATAHCPVLVLPGSETHTLRRERARPAAPRGAPSAS